MAIFYDEVAAPVAYVPATMLAEFGFVPSGVKFELQSGGPVEFSFDGVTTHGTLGPAGTRSIVFQAEHISAKSGVWFQSAGGETINVYAWDKC